MNIRFINFDAFFMYRYPVTFDSCFYIYFYFDSKVHERLEPKSIINLYHLAFRFVNTVLLLVIDEVPFFHIFHTIHMPLIS